MRTLTTYHHLQFLKHKFSNKKFAAAKYLLFLVTLVVSALPSHTQPNRAVFTLNGSANRDTGTMILYPFNTAFYPTGAVIKETKIENGKFSFTDSISYPYAYSFGFKIGGQKIYISHVFFVEPGQQTVVCNIDSLRETPELNNHLMKEYKDDYIGKYGDIHYRAGDLLQYTKQHPNSYVSLWSLVNQFDQGYKPEYDSIYDLFSDTIKSTYTAAVLAQKLYTARVAAIGRQFPKYLLLNVNNKTVTAPGPINSKYTLIDFWYSHCGSCISEFPALKKLFADCKRNGFNIIGISVDDEANKQNWLKAIHKYKLSWQQYLDLGGAEAYKLGIGAYPSNFLLDSTGKIIAKDMSMVELDKFLRDRQLIE